ncbi:MAG TPA: hypothetical protein VES20_17740 [Bryobacteraceae bacterium]|nr:hypothetical protein [Bryobacteraceae bacterium]
MYLRAAYVVLVLNAAEPWNTRLSLHSALPAEGKPVAYWRGQDAAFLAVHVPGKGVQSVVRTNQGRVEFRFDGERVHGPGEDIDSLDLSGRRTGDHVVLFHTEPALARSVLSFDAGSAADSLNFVITGLAPGVWEVWRNGWVVDQGVTVRAGEAVLFFQERSGSYFIRRL